MRKANSAQPKCLNVKYRILGLSVYGGGRRRRGGEEGGGEDRVRGVNINICFLLTPLTSISSVERVTS